MCLNLDFLVLNYLQIVVPIFVDFKMLFNFTSEI